MKLFSDCTGECCICAAGGGCLAGHGDDDFSPASKEQIIERLDKGEYRSYTDMMKRHLKRQFGYDYDTEKKRKELELTLVEAILTDPSMAIENQERRGQAEVIARTRLPKKSNPYSIPVDIRRKGVKWGKQSPQEAFAIEQQNNIEYTRLKYVDLGITIVNDVDEIFYDVALPNGWSTRATEHPMWNDLLDEDGTEVGKFFYKASFYDRDAFVVFNAYTRK